jgi:hypothetical protein
MAYEAKYLQDGGPVDDFIASVENPKRRADAEATLSLYRDVTGLEPRMWGASIVGFGESVFLYPSGNKSPVPAACFSPRKACMVLYLGRDFEDAEALYARLGKHTTSSTGGCININKLADVDLEVLREIVDRSFRGSLQRASA